MRHLVNQNQPLGDDDLPLARCFSSSGEILSIFHVSLIVLLSIELWHPLLIATAYSMVSLPYSSVYNVCQHDQYLVVVVVGVLHILEPCPGSSYLLLSDNNTTTYL